MSEQRAKLAQQRVTGTVATGVVDDLELVEIEIEQRVRGLTRFRTFQCALDAILKLGTINETGQNIVACVIAETTVQITRLTHIVEDEDTTGNAGLAVTNR